MLGREQFSAILTRVVAESEENRVDVTPERSAAGERPVVAAPAEDHLANIGKEKDGQT